jgi:hypothetical protein
MRSLSLRPDDSLTIPKDGFVDRLHSLRLHHECDPSYRVLTLDLVGLPPTESTSVKLGHTPITLLCWQYHASKTGRSNDEGRTSKFARPK